MIDPTAIVDSSAKIGKNVSVGPYSIIGRDVEVGDGTSIGPHVVVKGPTRIGKENRIFQFSSIGEDPQDKKYSGEKEGTSLEIGDRNTIREFCTIHRGTVQGGGITRLGSDNWIMAYVHIAHDCIIGDSTTFSNNSSLGGHVVVEDFAILGGFTLVHQFCRIGAYSFSAFSSTIVKDVPPYVIVSHKNSYAHGINSVGLKRNGFSPEEINQLRRAYKMIYRQNLTIEQARERLASMAEGADNISRLVEFIDKSTRGILR